MWHVFGVLSDPQPTTTGLVVAKLPATEPFLDTVVSYADLGYGAASTALRI